MRPRSQCRCQCHSNPDVKHVMACCYPDRKVDEMVVEYQVKRTIWIAECNCKPDGFRTVVTENAPRETMCPNCKKWVPFVESSAVSPEYKMLNEAR